MQEVVVGMSGGVDSSVTAHLMQAAGHRVTGLFMRNWREEGGPCPAAQDAEDVAAVCAVLGIPFYTVDFADEYWDRVFARFVEDYRRGYTPNPDILCNREIKFDAFLQRALDLGAERVATGHYARIVERDGVPHLARGADPEKDQSYFLYAIRREVLGRILFPIGNLPKREVRALARQVGLPTAAKKDSTGICFIGKRDFRPFLAQYIQRTPGAFVTPEGKVVGEHEGMSFYTLGQRKGLAIGGEGEAWYVVDKDPATNTVTVVQGEQHPLLYQTTLQADEINWLSDVTFPLRCTAKIRYRQPDQACTVTQMGTDKLRVEFDQPQKAVTPRQSVVFYDGEICLGGGMILPKETK
ncbi:MAG: tRNA 2-thiouridine(34) synthase MnmA [Chlamydiia bacterium]